jgi:hypothetical protein
MDTEIRHDPLHVALKYVSGACIDENFLEEAEAMMVFLEMVRVAPRTVGLLSVWTRSQRGDLREALRRCNELSEIYPEAEEFEPLLAVLRYAAGEPTWRAVCDRLVASHTANAESKKLAASLLDGSFGRPKAPQGHAEEEAPASAQAGPAVESYDFALHGGFMRA